MIKITIEKIKQNIVTIKVSGHSGYDVSGKDIVCAAVSTLTQNLINGLVEVVKIKPSYKVDDNNAYLEVILPTDLTNKQMQDSQILMQSTYLGLKNLQDSYSKFINIKELQND